MTDPTPPSERPLPEEARSRIRDELLAHAELSSSSAPRWVVPAGAAAAVALVAGMVFWAVSLADGDEVQPAPVTGGGATSATAVSSEADPPPPPPSTITMTSRPEKDPCLEELLYVLEGAERVLDAGDVSYWVKGDRFSMCYELDRSTSVTRPLPLSPREEVASYRVVSLYRSTADGSRTVRVAGGVVPDGLAGVFDVAYIFPDGHTEHAVSETDESGRTWWRMVYSYDDDENEPQQPEIEVTVSYSGVQHTYTLQWGPPDTCAQANHGC